MVVARSLGREMGKRLVKEYICQTVGLEKAPESLLDSTKIKPFNLKGNQPCTDAQAEDPVF